MQTMNPNTSQPDLDVFQEFLVLLEAGLYKESKLVFSKSAKLRPFIFLQCRFLKKIQVLEDLK